MNQSTNSHSDSAFKAGHAFSFSCRPGSLGVRSCRGAHSWRRDRFGFAACVGLRRTPPASWLSPSSRIVKSLVVAAVALALLEPVALAQAKAAKIDSLMTQYHQKGAFNGTVLVAEKGSVIFKKGYGMAD